MSSFSSPEETLKEITLQDMDIDSQNKSENLWKIRMRETSTRKKVLYDPYSQPEEISNATKYNNNDTHNTDGSEALNFAQNMLSASSTDRDSYVQDLNTNSNAYQVTGFFRAVLRKVIPEDFWGCDDNLRVILNAIEKFVKLRRYEVTKFYINLRLWYIVNDRLVDDITCEVRVQQLNFGKVWWL
ncbi:telomere reverse transcriptase [Gigaspora margarita]|uniref:Telomerase reverse transcriptase n=1 Tax=Gigaspora margarita TaxID=4874 RepID=A0A8H4AQ93_GIGMA|nr:telomere reverse transcriptase [Gigaspora margarita]